MNRLLLFLTFSLLLLSCNKWKKPTEVTFYATKENPSSLNGQLVISSIKMELESFSFEGDREKGDDVLFTNTYSGNEKITFGELSEIGFMDFEIPQGEYKRIDIELDLDSESQESIVIEGSYTDNNAQTTPILFVFDDDDKYRIRAEDDTGESDIILDTDVPSRVKILMDASYIFSVIPQSQFENATISNVNGNSTILINDSVNEDIYDLIIDRLEESLQVRFNF